MEQITSRHNPLILHLKKLGMGKYRRQTGEFLCEGPKLLAEAEKWGWEVRCVCATREDLLLPWAQQGVRAALVSPEVLAAAADTKTPQQVVFSCALPGQAPPALEHPRLLVLDGVQDPGNVGTIWRTADAFGADALVLLPGCADPFAPKTVRATMGACFRLPVWSCTLEQLTAALDARGIPLVATALGPGTRDVRQAGLAQAAVVIGSEGRGVSPQVLERCDLTVKIPMRPRCESLNAAVAAGVILWELYR